MRGMRRKKWRNQVPCFVFTSETPVLAQNAHTHFEPSGQRTRRRTLPLPTLPSSRSKASSRTGTQRTTSYDQRSCGAQKQSERILETWGGT